MRKALLLTIAGLLLSSVAFAATTYTDTLYPNPYGGIGNNWIAVKGVPFTPDPIAVFGDLGRIDDGRLTRLEPTTGNLEGYYSFQEPGGPFGNILLGDGYFVLADAEYGISYSGVDDGVPSDPTNPGTTMTDMWISLPGVTGAAGGLHLIGFPFAHNVPFANVLVTDGTQTVDVPTAVGLGWLEDNWYYLDGATQNLGQLDRDGIIGSDQMEAGRAYQVVTHKANIALIIPAGTL